MFTGIVRELGRLISPPQPSAHGGVALRIGHSEELSERLEIGASLAVSGVCLTLVKMRPGESVVELSPETLERTGLGSLVEGSAVNLEPALCAGEALGGHWVQGHVDGRLQVVDRRDLGDHRELAFELPEAYAAYVVEKGSVTLDGVSLTVSNLLEPVESRGYVGGSRIEERAKDEGLDGEGVETGDGAKRASSFEVALIPHTLEVTTLGDLEIGDLVCFEVDILAKYVERSLVISRRRLASEAPFTLDRDNS